MTIDDDENENRESNEEFYNKEGKYDSRESSKLQMKSNFNKDSIKYTESTGKNLKHKSLADSNTLRT